MGRRLVKFGSPSRRACLWDKPRVSCYTFKKRLNCTMERVRLIAEFYMVVEYLLLLIQGKLMDIDYNFALIE